MRRSEKERIELKRQQEVIRCFRCGAVYARYAQWCFGYDEAEGTETSRFVKVGEVEEGHCPMCRKPPQLEPTPPWQAM